MSIIHEIKYVNACAVEDLGAKSCQVPLAITPQPVEDHQAKEKKKYLQ